MLKAEVKKKRNISSYFFMTTKKVGVDDERLLTAKFEEDTNLF